MHHVEDFSPCGQDQPSHQQISTRDLKCPLHTTETVSIFCKTCGKVLCDRCGRLGAHTGHSCVSIGKAESEARKAVEDCLFGARYGLLPQLERAAADVQSVMDGVNDDVEQASAQVTALVERIVKVVKNKETELLAELEKIRWKSLQPLEVQLQNVNELKDSAERVRLRADDVLEQCGKHQLVQAFPWIRENYKMVTKAKSKYASPQRRVRVRFEDLSARLEEVAQRDRSVGRVSVAEEHAPPTKPVLFDREACGNSVRISAHLLAATTRKSTYYAHSVLGRNLASGQWRIRLKGNDTNLADICLGVSTKTPPGGYNKSALGLTLPKHSAWLWSSRSKKVECASEINPWTDSGLPPWQNGDTLLLDMDARAGKLSLTHVPSGKTSTIAGVSQDVFPYFGMSRKKGQRFLLLPS